MTRIADDLVSVIVPAYNAERWVGATLASALAQTHRNLEVIVVDDGSRDNTSAIVEAFAARDPRVRLLRQANRGVGWARNAAITASNGSLVAPLDQDDLWHPEKVAKQVAALQRGGPTVGLVYTWHSTIDEADRVIGRIVRPRFEGNVYAALVLGNFISSASTPLFRRSCLTETGGYSTDPDCGYCEDWKLNLDIAERYEFALVPEFLVGYRLTPGSMSQNVEKSQRCHAAVLAEARQRHPELPESLFRDARTGFCYWFGLNSLRNGQIRGGLSLIAKIALNDPLFPIRPLFRQAAARAARKFGRRIGFVENYLGRHFSEVPPR